ncbi:MAG: glutathione S-transferase family protein [Waterburya sp.]
MLTQETVSSWENLFEIAKANTNAKWMHRSGQSPATAAIPDSLDKISSEQEVPVLLYKDTNSWCPYCERVVFALEEKEIPYQVEFIALDSKPQWYLDIVPTGLVPAAKIAGEIIYESQDILLALEDKFSPSLLPSESTLKEAASEAIAQCDAKSLIQAGYKFIWGLSADGGNLSSEELLSLQTDFESKLEVVEKLLSKYPGDYFMGEFSLVDIMYAPHLTRIAANLPVYRDYNVRGNERFPNLNRWYEAIDSRPAYERIKSDTTTNNLVLRRIFGLQPAIEKHPLATQNLQTNTYRMEAAAKLSDNHQAIIGDIFKNSGLEAMISQEDRHFASEALDLHLRMLAEYLIAGREETLVGGRVGGKGGTDAKVAAIGAIALAFLRNRASAPRDMSAGAAKAFRGAIDMLMQAIY